MFPPILRGAFTSKTASLGKNSISKDSTSKIQHQQKHQQKQHKQEQHQQKQHPSAKTAPPQAINSNNSAAAAAAAANKPVTIRVRNNTCLLQSRDAKHNHVKREGPEGHAVERQRQSEGEPEDMERWDGHDLHRGDDAFRTVLYLRGVQRRPGMGVKYPRFLERRDVCAAARAVEHILRMQEITVFEFTPAKVGR